MFRTLLSSTATRTRAAGWLVIVLAVWVSGCWPSPAESTQPREGRSGLQLTGSIAGRQLAVSDGSPQVTAGDCDPDVSGDSDVCAIGQSIDGELVVVVFENPDVLVAGASLPVADPGCGARCDQITDAAVIDLQVGTGRRMRARGGRLELEEVTPFSRYAGEVRVSFASGAVAGSFDLVPRSD
jgi:hypothetical protein